MGKMREPWWGRAAHIDRRPLLLCRNAVKVAARRYFENDGFLEVECGALQASPGNEAHLHAFATTFADEAGDARRFYLHTSPEFACKKLLAAGESRIFDFARVYRNRESGPLHAPEFTMLEWYRAREPLETVMTDCVELCRLAARTAQRSSFTWRGAACDPCAEPERLTLTEAFERYVSLDLPALLADRDKFARATDALGVRVGEDDGWSDLFSRILVERIEPRLGKGRLTLLCDYPLSEAALARPSPHDPRFAERFELYACGVELANGFGELTDPHEQRRRFMLEMAEKQRLYDEIYPIDEDFLRALANMPEASGVALGFDRLVMLAVGAWRIEDVLWTPLAQL